MKNEYTHVAFSDDSSHVDRRFNSLCLITMKKDIKQQLSYDSSTILKESGVKSEFKWEKLRDAKHYFVAEKMIDLIFDNQKHIRIDILIWDMEDSRHKGIQGRNNEENLARLYYHLFSSTISKRWCLSAVWNWFPDEQSGIDWKLLEDCICNKKYTSNQRDLFNSPNLKKIRVNKISPSNSSDYVLIQLADLFAGIGSYSHGHHRKYKQWEEENSNQMSLFKPDDSEVTFSNSERARFEIISYLKNKCEENNLKISFDKTPGFKTNDPSIFLNFWRYESQHPFDKAPIKKK